MVGLLKGKGKPGRIYLPSHVASVGRPLRGRDKMGKSVSGGRVRPDPGDTGKGNCLGPDRYSHCRYRGVFVYSGRKKQTDRTVGRSGFLADRNFLKDWAADLRPGGPQAAESLSCCPGKSGGRGCAGKSQCVCLGVQLLQDPLAVRYRRVSGRPRGDRFLPGDGGGMDEPQQRGLGSLQSCLGNCHSGGHASAAQI